jgi:nucleoside-diphosphate kinase
MPQEQSFVMVKPDGVQRRLVGELISRLERKGLQLVAMKMLQMDESLAAKHYEEHQGKSFYPYLMQFITSSPVIATVWQGENAIATIRKIMGPTNLEKAEPGSIRGDFALCTTLNLMHASDSPSSAAREIPLFFNPSEILNYTPPNGQWLCL